MNDTEELLIYKLYKKGPANFTQFDKVLIESNPVIREGLDELIAQDRHIHEAASAEVDRHIAALLEGESKEKRLFFPLKYMVVPAAAACFLIFITFFINYISPRASLGGSVALFVSPAGNQDRFYRQGSSFEPGEQVRLAFQPDSQAGNIKQGIVFSIDSRAKIEVYYRYNSEAGPLNQAEPTHIDRVIELESDQEYIYFFVILSRDTFNEQEHISRVRQILAENPRDYDRILKKYFKQTPFSHVYLKGPAQEGKPE